MHQADLSFVGHVGEGLKTLRKEVSANPVWKNGEPEKVRRDLKSIFSGTVTSGTGEEWGPGAVVDVVRKALPRNGVATVDSGAHRTEPDVGMLRSSQLAAIFWTLYDGLRCTVGHGLSFGGSGRNVRCE
jgi:thiamine pyrophosphate-dependent acetolactate synthase large subunit-like protein